MKGGGADEAISLPQVDCFARPGSWHCGIAQNVLSRAMMETVTYRLKRLDAPKKSA